jgi:alpha-beta hydrolase superfamily lysophospholipase
MIHSPLVGPLTLTPLADHLRGRGFDVMVPDLRTALSKPRPQWRAILDLIEAVTGSVDVLVAHSGAGVLMPLVADQVDPAVVAFIDAVVPGFGPHHQASKEFTEFVDSLPSDDGLLLRGTSGGEPT